MRTIVIDALNLGQYHRYWLEHFRLRRQIFVERLDWGLASHDGLEFDSFDTPAARYVLVIDAEDRVCALSRLIPTTSPYMIETLWPEWPSGECAKSADVWEASRFGCRADMSVTERQDAIQSVFRTIYDFGREHGIDHYLMVMPKFIFERLIRRHGYQVDYVGEQRRFDGILTCLGKVTITPSDMSLCDPSDVRFAREG